MRRIIYIAFALLLSIGMMAQGSTTTKKKAPKEKPIKHYIDIYGGGGVSSMGYHLDGGKTMIGYSYSFGVGYTWFFRPYMGLQTGLSFTRIGSSASLTDPMEWSKHADGTPITDWMGDTYVHRVSFDNWRESQQSYLIQIPIGLRFRYFADKSSKAGLHAAAGINLSLPVITSYTHSSGSVTHSAWYEQWQLELTDLPGRFGTETLTSKQEESINSKVKKLNAELYGEIGASIRLNVRTEMFIAAYAQYMLNDFSAVKKDARTPLGFSSPTYNYPFMTEYRGLIGTDKISSMHPWTAGIKVGVSVFPGKTEKERIRELKKLAKRYPDQVPMREVHDTTIIRDTVYLRDTTFRTHTVIIHDTVEKVVVKEVVKEVEKVVEKIVIKEVERPSTDTHSTYIPKKEPVSQPHEQLDSLLSEAVIWFHFDEYTPILEPADIIDSIVEMLNRYPHLKVQINGHACSIGTESYNKQLALRRAKAVALLLEKKGISRDRMKVQSFGASHPYRYNKPASPKDRRVEIIPD